MQVIKLAQGLLVLVRQQGPTAPYLGAARLRIFPTRTRSSHLPSTPCSVGRQPSDRSLRHVQLRRDRRGAAQRRDRVEEFPHTHAIRGVPPGGGALNDYDQPGALEVSQA